MASISSVLAVAGFIALIRYLINCDKTKEESIMIKKIKDSEYQHQTGLVHFKNNNYAQALLFISKAISIYPTALYYNDRACIYSAVDKFEKAIEDYNQAIKLEPHESHLYLGRGMMYFQKQLFENCYNDWRKSKNLGSSDAKEFLRIHFEAKPAWFTDTDKINHFEYMNTTNRNFLPFENDTIPVPYCQNISYLNESTYKIFLN